MPFGHWASFDDCVGDMQAKNGYDIETAKATCGKLQAEMGGSVDSNFVNYELDKNGDLILKYFFADTSLTELPTAHGQFSLDGAALAQADREAVGLPFSILPSRDLSVFGDYHPWHPDLGQASWEQHVDFAKKYSPGHIVAITPSSQLLGAAQDVVANNGRFALVKITDNNAKNAYVSNPALIPKQVSPGFLNFEAPNRDGIKNLKWTHLAAVPQGAYGKKATLYGSCIGPNDVCVNKLLGASAMVKLAAETQQKYGVKYCAVGASESILNTSLSNSQANSINNMSVNPTLDSSTTTNQTPSSTAPTQTTQPTQKAPVVTEQKKVVRLKGAVQTPQTAQEVPQAGQDQLNPNQPKTPDMSKFEEVEKRLAEIEAREQLQNRLGQIRNLIDMRLFVTGGKYNQKEHEAAIQEAAGSQWSDEQIAKYYGGLLKIKEFEEAQNPKNQRNNLSYNPLGGSGSSYSAVPEGASADMDLETFRAQKVKGLMNMFGVMR